jgi:hypothetical protein
MATITREPVVRETPPRGIAGRLLVPGFWATICIAAMWLAVLFVGVFGGQMTFVNSPASVTTIPAAVMVALFAAIGTSAVAKRAFTRKGPGEQN